MLGVVEDPTESEVWEGTSSESYCVGNVLKKGLNNGPIRATDAKKLPG
jgi:hypothetical protein